MLHLVYETLGSTPLLLMDCKSEFSWEEKIFQCASGKKSRVIYCPVAS